MDHPQQITETAPKRTGWIVPTAFSGLLLVTAIGAWSVQRSPAPLQAPAPTEVATASSGTAVPDVPEPAASSKVASTDDLLGTWICNDGIRRCINVREDGTASMQVQLDFIPSLIYGSELNLELTWELNGNSLVYSAVSGEPKENVERLLRDFGRRQVYEIVDFKEGRMLLEQISDKCRYDWHRAEL